MKEALIYLGVASLGCTVYHLGQKLLPASINPMVLLMGVYGFAFLLSALAAPFFQGTAPAGSVWRAVLSWPVLVVGLGAFLIEIGFLLAYRRGGALQWSGVAVNGLAAVLLLPVAILVFREKLSLVRALGILVTLAGMGMLTVK